jgi:alkaline phosphatase
MISIEVDRESRRAFLERGALILSGLAAGALPRRVLAAEDAAPALRIGLVTDCHHADLPPWKNRYYRESIGKFHEAIDKFNAAGVDMAIEIGDLIDAGPDVAGEIGNLRKIEKAYAQFRGERYYVLGNHCIWTLTKQEFCDNCAIRAPHYSFDRGGFHFVVLDACFRTDGVAYGRQNYQWQDTFIPPEQIEWLRGDLATTALPTIVFVHQRLDTNPGDELWALTVKDAPEVRKVLETSGKVLAVLQGHSHHNDYRELAGIHYCVLRAVVEGSGAKQNGYAVLNLFGDGSLRIDGFRRQVDYRWD